MKFEKQYGNIIVSEILPGVSEGITVYKHAGNQYSFTASKIGMGFTHIEADSDVEACRIIEEKINLTLDNLYEALLKREQDKVRTMFFPIIESKNLLKTN